MDTGSDNWHSRTHRKTELLLFQSHPAITAYDDHTLLIGIDGGGVHTVNLETKRSNLLFNTEDNSDIYLQGNGVMP